MILKGPFRKRLVPNKLMSKHAKMMIPQTKDF